MLFIVLARAIFHNYNVFILFPLFARNSAPTVPVVCVGKEGRTLINLWGYLNRKLPFIELP